MNLDVNDPVTREHLPAVIGQAVSENCQNTLKETPNEEPDEASLEKLVTPRGLLQGHLGSKIRPGSQGTWNSFGLVGCLGGF